MVAVPVAPAFIPPPQIVPGVRGAPLMLAYSVLREQGLAVTIHGPFRAGTLICQPLVKTQSPGVDRTVSAGAIISLSLVPNHGCGQASPALPTGPLPSATVPDLIGMPVSRAVRWAKGRDLYWSTGPLGTVRDANTHQLLANWRITTQSPQPGKILRLGTGSRRGSAHSFTPTPLRLSAEPATAGWPVRIDPRGGPVLKRMDPGSVVASADDRPGAVTSPDPGGADRATPGGAQR
jgi:hypothetical protein